MTTNPTHHTFTSLELAYIQSALQRAEKALWKDRWINEIISDVGLRLTNGVARIMQDYPNPQVWANVVVPTIRIDVMRRDNAQRAAGARNQRMVGELNDLALNEYEANDGYSDAADRHVGEVNDPMALIPQSLLARLSEKQVTLFRLREVEGFTTAEAAKKVGTSANNASRLIAAAQRMLREEWGAA